MVKRVLNTLVAVGMATLMCGTTAFAGESAQRAEA